MATFGTVGEIARGRVFASDPGSWQVVRANEASQVSDLLLLGKGYSVIHSC